MSTELQLHDNPMLELDLVKQAIAEFEKIAQGLADLNTTYGGVVYDVRTSKGMSDAVKARAVIREPRIAVEKRRKIAKAPLLNAGRWLDSRAEWITDELLKIEEPIDQQIKAEEARKEAAKQAAIDAENTRVARIQTAIDEIRELPLSASGKTASHAQGVLNDAEAMVITEEQYQEFFQVAQSALYASIISLKGVVTERMAHEAEQERVQQERLELAKLRAADELRQKAERERIAEESRKQREDAARLAAENAKAEAALKAQCDELDRREQEANASRLAEDVRVQKLQEDESNRLAAEREQLERERAELSAPKKAVDVLPTQDEIIAALCVAFGLDAVAVQNLLASFKWRKA